MNETAVILLWAFVKAIGGKIKTSFSVPVNFEDKEATPEFEEVALLITGCGKRG